MAGASASFLSTKETTNYARLCRLLVDVGAHVLRETFDKIYPPAGLYAVLHLPRNHNALQLLQRRRILNPTQWGKLYPAIPTSVSSKEFDITLLTVLLRNICGLSPPATGWDALPSVTDTSVQADIARVKYFRNTVYGHADQASVVDATFNAYWQDIRVTLVRLGGTTFGKAIDDLKNECMDPEIEDHYEELLRQWEKDDDNMKDMLKEIDRKLEEWKTSTSTSQAKDVEDPTDLIERICQLYRTRESRLSPFPWHEEFNFGLNDIFTKLKIVSRDKTRRTVTEQLTSMTEVFKPHKECPKPRTVLIEGEPGMGKTTYCQKLAYDWANGQETDASFPQIKLLLLLKCHEMSGNIWEAIDDQLLPKDIEEEAKENFFKYIRANQSQVLLVLDGLDEAPSNSMQMISDLVESRELPKCHIILTSRHEGAVKVSKYCDTLLQILGFTEEDSRSFILRYFKDMEVLGQKLLKEIECKKELKELTVNPLTTALLCLLYEDFKGSLPLSKTSLYLEITNCVLRRFHRKKGLPETNENLLEVYNEDLERLGLMALNGLEKDQMHFEENELGGSTGEIPVFEFLSVQTGSSKRRPHQCYVFSHKSFQDFFAGFYLSRQISKGEIDFEWLLANHEGVVCKLDRHVVWFAVGIHCFQHEEVALDVLKAVIKKINLHANNAILQDVYLWFTLKFMAECSTANSRLRTQMLHSLGTGLQLECLILEDSRCDIQLLAEALKANNTITKLEFPGTFFGDLCVMSLAGTLRVNKTLTEVNIPGNIISARGAQQLVNALMVNTTLLRLNLSFNILHDDGARLFAEFVKASKALTALNLAGNDIGNPGATSLAGSLQMNTTLKVLDLSGNPSIGNSGVNSLCEALKVNRTLTHLNLSGNGVGDAGIRSLSAVLKNNTSLTSLALSDVKISAYTVRSVADFLTVNSTLTHLEFLGNKISVGGARLIAEALKVNTSLAFLGLSQNALGARGAQLLSEGLGANTALAYLDLSRNCIGAAGAESIAVALKVNTSLAFLDLSWNAVGALGAPWLSEGLKVNAALTHLRLPGNFIGAAGAEAIADALKVNSTMTSLDLSINNIGDSGVQSLSEALKANATLTELDISYNGIKTSGARSFAEIRKTNNTLKSVKFMDNIGAAGWQALLEAGF